MSAPTAAPRSAATGPLPLAAPLGLFFVVFVVMPLLLLAYVSLHTDTSLSSNGIDQYRKFLGDAFNLAVLRDTMWLGVKVTVLTLMIGYPLAWVYVQAPSRWQPVLMLLIVLPLLTSSVVRTFAWVVILGRQGIVNSVLTSWGLIDAPIKLLYTPGAVTVALAQIELPLMVLPLITALSNIDPALRQASLALGAGRWRTFLQVTLPLSMPGLLAGCLLVFASSVSAFVTQTLVGGGQQMFMPFYMYQQAIQANDYPFAATIAMVLLMAPTVIVLITSFTSGFSLKFPPPGWSPRWYLALWNESPEIVDAFLLSLRLAAIATSVSIVLAVAAALAIARRREAWARLVESLFLSPLMLPTLALGLALLMLFNLAGTGLSFGTLVLGHVAITAPYVFRTTAASLLQLDASLLESARSLGASPTYAFRTVTLPLILRGVLAGAFIGFMYSFDNVAVSLFLSDARSEVLPIRMWHMIESNLDVRAAAISGVLISVTLVLMVVMERVAGVSRHMR